MRVYGNDCFKDSLITNNDSLFSFKANFYCYSQQCVGLLNEKPGKTSKPNMKSISSAISSQQISGKNAEGK